MKNYVSRSGGDGLHVLGKSLWLFQIGQKQSHPQHQLKLVLRNSLYCCERYLLIHYSCLSALVGIEMSIPGFLDLLRYFDGLLVTSSILIQCSALWFIQLVFVLFSRYSTSWLYCWPSQDADKTPFSCSFKKCHLLRLWLTRWYRLPLTGCSRASSLLSSKWSLAAGGFPVQQVEFLNCYSELTLCNDWLDCLVLLGVLGEVFLIGVCSY